jgi:hypothetical protein
VGVTCITVCHPLTVTTDGTRQTIMFYAVTVTKLFDLIPTPKPVTFTLVCVAERDKAMRYFRSLRHSTYIRAVEVIQVDGADMVSLARFRLQYGRVWNAEVPQPYGKPLPPVGTLSDGIITYTPKA